MSEAASNERTSQAVAARAFNPSAQAEAGGSLGVPGQPGLRNEFQDSQGCYTDKPYLQK